MFLAGLVLSAWRVGVGFLVMSEIVRRRYLRSSSRLLDSRFAVENWSLSGSLHAPLRKLFSAYRAKCACYRVPELVLR